MRDQNPDKKVTEIATMLGDLWKNMDPAEKITYQEKYNENKLKFQNLMENYSKQHPKEIEP